MGREPGALRKPYKVSKQRVPWSQEEHGRFLEAIDRYGRAWPRIVSHVGTRSVQQVRSHAQKYFLKLEKAGNQDAVPPPRPKKRAARPYPTLGSGNRRARGERGSRPGRRGAGCSGSGAEDSECADWPASSGGRSPRMQATTRAAARCRADTERGRTAQSDQPSSPAKAEGDGSTGERSSGGTCAENSAHSTGENVFPGGLEVGLDVARGSFAVPPVKQDVAGPSGRQAAQGAKQAQSGAPASKAAAVAGGNDFGRLYNLVGSLCEAEPEAKQRMLEQLEPSQRASLAAMMGHLTGNLRAASGSGSGSLSAGASGGAGASAPSPFAAPEVQAPAAVAQTLAACGARPGAALPASLEPYAAGPGLGLGLGSGRGLQLGGRLLDESSSVPQLVGLPPPLAPQPDAQLLPAQPEASSLPGGAFNPSRATPVDGNASLVSSTDRFGGDGGSSACELDGGARFASVTGGAAAALEADLARSHAMALAQQQCAQMPAQVPPGTYTDFMRHAAQLAHHQMELAQAQLLPHVLPPGPLAMCVETTQPAPSVPADFLPKWQAECDPAWQGDVDAGADLAVPAVFSY